MDPNVRLPQGAKEEAFATNTMEGLIVPGNHAHTATCATNVMDRTPGVYVPVSNLNQSKMKSAPPNGITNPQELPSNTHISS